MKETEKSNALCIQSAYYFVSKKRFCTLYNFDIVLVSSFISITFL